MAAESSVDTLRCFVIGPIGNRHAAIGTEERTAYEEAVEILEHVIEPACKAVGLSPVRADGIAVGGEITEQVFRRLRDDDVVIADLTGANANVMYELGLRHTRDKLTFHIGEFGRLPFDVNVIRTVQFSRSQSGLIRARQELVRFLEAGLAGEYDLATPTRLWLGLTASEPASDDAEMQGTTSDDHDVVPSEDDAPGLLDLFAAAEEGGERLVESSVHIGETIGAIGTLAEDFTRRATESDARGLGMKGRLALLVDYASSLDELAGDLGSTTDDYVVCMGALSLATGAIIERMEADHDEVTQGTEWGLMTRRIAATARESLASLAGLAESLESTAHLARVVRPPTRKVLDALSRFSAATSTLDEWDRRLQALGIPIPPEDWAPSD